MNEIRKRPYNKDSTGKIDDVIYDNNNNVATYYDCGCVTIHNDEEITLFHKHCRHHQDASNLRLYTIIGILLG